MDPERRYPFLSSLLSSFSLRHRKTLGLVIAAITVTGQARSFAIATTLMGWLGTRLDSAVNRFYRLLRNPRVDYTRWITSWAQLLVKGQSRQLLVAVDWTEWHHDLRMLVAAVVAGRRAIPLYAEAFDKLIRRRSQNARENTFARVLADSLRRAGVSATLLCDRGFRRASWLKLLQQLGLGFVVRLMDDVTVEVAPDVSMPLRNVLLTPGQLLDLGVVALRSDGAVRVRIIGYWAPGRSEPWWLATSVTAHPAFILKLYDRRMTIEEQFRDTKGRRFGAKLFWTQFRNPEALGRFVMLLGVALLIWTITGFVAAHYDPSLLLVCRKKGPRQSFVTIGLRVAQRDCPVAFNPRDIGWFLEPPVRRQLGAHSVGGK